MSTHGFRGLNVEQRKCHLKNEVDKNSIFKIYTKNNCIYECHVKLVKDICKCIPWDFMHKHIQMPECDVFGRTCFFKSMKNLTQSPQGKIEFTPLGDQTTSYFTSELHNSLLS